MYNVAEVSRHLVERISRGFERWATACIYPSSMFASSRSLSSTQRFSYSVFCRKSRQGVATLVITTRTFRVESTGETPELVSLSREDTLRLASEISASCAS